MMLKYVKSFLGDGSHADALSEPELPVVARFEEWLNAFNQIDQQALQDLHTDRIFPYSSSSGKLASPTNELRMAWMSGGFEVIGIESASPETLTAVLQEKDMKRYVRATMQIDTSTIDNSVKTFDIQPIITPMKYIPANDPRRAAYETAQQPLNASLRKKIVNAVIDLIQQRYPSPEISSQLVLALQANLGSGSYNSYETSSSFAQRLSSDAQSIAADKQLWISFNEPPLPKAAENAPRKTGFDFFRRTEYGLGTPIIVDSGPGQNFATLPIFEFIEADDEDTLLGIANILRSVADADELTLDLRESYGGSYKKAVFILSYLLDDAPKDLLNFFDKSGACVETLSTFPPTPHLEFADIFGGKKPIIVLTSERTSQAGEFMAYTLRKVRGRVEIIGEGIQRTMGNVGVSTRPNFVCKEDFGPMWWLVAVPNRRVECVVSGENWMEGVESDRIIEREDEDFDFQ